MNEEGCACVHACASRCLNISATTGSCAPVFDEIESDDGAFSDDSAWIINELLEKICVFRDRRVSRECLMTNDFILLTVESSYLELFDRCLRVFADLSDHEADLVSEEIIRDIPVLFREEC